MAVLNALSVTLEVPKLGPGVQFYSDAGLVADIDGEVAHFRCLGQDRDSIELRSGAVRKRLHHITLRATDLDFIASKVARGGGRILEPPPGFADQGLWVEDPHGMLVHLVECPPDPEPKARMRFEINAPGSLTRKGQASILPRKAYKPVTPLRLGHILLFSPDVPTSVQFITEVLGMCLADYVEDRVAFCCARKESDHHVLAFGKSSGVGFHHASFQVWDPDEVGRAGQYLNAKAGRGQWGFGRHTIGSNFFHYVQDPWGSWLEYFADMDYIDDYSQWTPTNYSGEDALSNWAPSVPDDFSHNYEADKCDTYVA